MNAAKANLLNALALILMGLWGYFATKSGTAFIPVAFGAGLLACYQGVKNENKVIAHIAVVLTLLVLIAMVGMRLPKAIETGGIGLVRSIIPIITGVIAMLYFIKSFRDARKAREAS